MRSEYAGDRRSIVTLPELITTVALAVSTLTVATVLSIGAVHAGTLAATAPVHATHTLSHVIDTLGAGLGGYAVLRALQRD